jgi:hypothetical protein
VSLRDIGNLVNATLRGLQSTNPHKDDTGEQAKHYAQRYPMIGDVGFLDGLLTDL